MILFTLPSTTFTAGQEVMFGPFTINDNVLSLMIETDQFAASLNPCLEARLERRISASEWELAGSYGIGARTITDRMNFIRIGLYPGTNRQYRAWVKAFETVTTGARIYNSVTIGTPGSANGFGTSGSVAVDAGSGADRCMVCAQCFDHIDGVHVDNFSVPLYNSVAMTEIQKTTAANNSVRLSRFLNPASGSHSLAFGVTAITTSWLIAGIPLSGVDQTTPNGTPVTGSSTGNPITSTVSSLVSTDLIVDVVSHTQNTGTLAADANQTERSKVINYGGTNRCGGSSTQSGADGGVMSWTPSVSDNWCQIAAAFKEAVSFSGNPPRPIVLHQAVKQSFSW